MTEGPMSPPKAKLPGAKHTPGPWWIDPASRGLTIRRVITDIPEVVLNLTIAEVRAVNEPVGEANARLIAAAPELLRELSDGYGLVLRLLTHVTHGKPTEEEAEAWLKAAQAAIAKAEAP